MKNNILPSASRRIRTFVQDNNGRLPPEFWDYYKKCPPELQQRLDFELSLIQDNLTVYNQLSSYIHKVLKNDSLFWLLSGRQRIGKTIAAYIIARIAGLKTTTIYNIEQLLEFLQAKPSNECVIFPDLTTIGLTSRKFSTRLGRDSQDLFNNLSVLHNLYIACFVKYEGALIDLRDTFTEVPIMKYGDFRSITIKDRDIWLTISIPKIDTSKIDSEDLDKKKEYFDTIVKKIVEQKY